MRNSRTRLRKGDIGIQIEGYSPSLSDKAEIHATTQVATVEIQGKRSGQEDAYSSTLLDDDALVNANLSDEKIKRAYESAFNNTFNAIQAKYADHAQGSTVAIAVAQLDEHNIAHVALAHLGDTETFMVISNQHANVARHRRINKTLHHAGTNQAECRRVTNTGRKIYRDRVCGKLTLTRAIGDKGILNTFNASDNITKTTRTIQCNEDHQPEIQFFDIALEKKQTAYIVSACDGLCEQIDEGIKFRNITITRQYLKHAEGSVLVEFGETKVICTASVSAGVPPFLKNSGQGWVTAEYGMLPRSTHDRMQREAAKGKQSGRTQEIQRLIGRSLRAAVDLKAMGENTIVVDCDVIQADGGTRTAAITGGCVALRDAITALQEQQHLATDPFQQFVASISVGLYSGHPVLDLDYAEDSNADTDMNVVMTDSGQFIEIQGTAEKATFSQEDLDTLMALAKNGIAQLIDLQKQA